MAPQNWRAFITLNEANVRGFPEQARQIAGFLDFMQTTPEGAAMLGRIAEKLPQGERFHITFDNRGRTHAMGPALHVNLQDFRTAQIRDRDTRMWAPAGHENILIHELSHAADPRLPFPKPGEVTPFTAGINNPYSQPGPDGVPPSEAHATRESAQFMDKYFPNRPVRGHYSDVQEGPQRDGYAAIEAARRNPAVGAEELRRICQNELRFVHGEVSPQQELHCQNLPNNRPTGTEPQR